MTTTACRSPGLLSILSSNCVWRGGNSFSLNAVSFFPELVSPFHSFLSFFFITNSQNMITTLRSFSMPVNSPTMVWSVSLLSTAYFRTTRWLSHAGPSDRMYCVLSPRSSHSTHSVEFFAPIRCRYAPKQPCTGRSCIALCVMVSGSWPSRPPRSGLPTPYFYRLTFSRLAYFSIFPEWGHESAAHLHSGHRVVFLFR